MTMQIQNKKFQTSTNDKDLKFKTAAEPDVLDFQPLNFEFVSYLEF